MIYLTFECESGYWDGISRIIDYISPYLEEEVARSVGAKTKDVLVRWQPIHPVHRGERAPLPNLVLHVLVPDKNNQTSRSNHCGYVLRAAWKFLRGEEDTSRYAHPPQFSEDPKVHGRIADEVAQALSFNGVQLIVQTVESDITVVKAEVVGTWDR